MCTSAARAESFIRVWRHTAEHRNEHDTAESLVIPILHLNVPPP